MAETNDIQPDRLLDLLYGELSDSEAEALERDIESSPELKAELDVLRRTSEAARVALPDEEPPVALTNMLLHEAAKQAAAVQADKVGLWDRMLAWFEPLVRHPALSAAMVLVLFVAVAGTVGLSKMGNEARSAADMAAEPPGGFMAGDAPAAIATAPGEAGDFKALKEETQAPPPSPEPEPTAGQAYGYAEDADGLEQLSADPMADEEVPLVEEQRLDQQRVDNRRQGQLATTDQEKKLADKGGELRLAPGRRSSSLGRGVGNYLDDVVATGEGRAEPVVVGKGDTAAKPKSKPVANSADKDRFRAAPVEQARERDSRIGGSVAGRVAPPADTADSAPAAPDQSPTKTAKKRSRKAAPKKTAPSAQRPAAAPPPAAVPAEAAEAEAEAGPVATTRSASRDNKRSPGRAASQRVLAQMQEVSRKVKSRRDRCRQIARLANDVLDADPTFYRSRVEKDPSVKQCARDVTAERRSRAKRRKQPSKAKAAEAVE